MVKESPRLRVLIEVTYESPTSMGLPVTLEQSYRLVQGLPVSEKPKASLERLFTGRGEARKFALQLLRTELGIRLLEKEKKFLQVVESSGPVKEAVEGIAEPVDLIEVRFRFALPERLFRESYDKDLDGELTKYEWK